MKPQTLKEAKKSIEKFSNAIKPVFDHWESNKFTMLSVLLQNLYFYSVTTSDYAHEKEVTRCAGIIKAIEDLANYDTKCHVTNYVADEVLNIWDVCLMIEEQENI